MAMAFPRVYRSFSEFEQSELTKFDAFYQSVDEMMDEMLLAELEEELRAEREEDGILFDRLDD